MRLLRSVGEHQFCRNLSVVAVGTIITDRPPRRSVRARLRIRLPTWMSGEKVDHRIRMQNTWGWHPSREDPGCPIPRHGSLTAALGASVTENSGEVLRQFAKQSSHTKASIDFTGLMSELKACAYKPRLAEARRVFAWASSGRSEWTPSQFFSSWV